jgi:uncharacterized protein (DUF2147 family)
MQDAQFFMRRKVLGNLRRAALVIALALPCLGFAAARADQGSGPVSSQAAQGWWLNDDGDSAIYIAPCGAALCGYVEWLKTPLDAQGKPKTDIHNPDAALQSRPICGLQMMGGMTPDGSGGWQDGWAYDPKVGKTYKAIMHVAPDGSLRLHGYIGVPLFGRSKTMTRPGGTLTPCAPGLPG